jgi:hypothetical protein
MDLTGTLVLLHCDGCGDTTAFDVQTGGTCKCRKCRAVTSLWSWRNDYPRETWVA